MKKLVLTVAALAVVGGTSVISAHAENFSAENTFGVGLLLGSPSKGSGAMASYWITNNIGVSAIATLAYNDYSEYGIRADYLFNADDWGNIRIRPFIGAGLSFIDGPSGHGTGPYSSWSYDVDGKGAEVHAGILHQAAYISPNLFFNIAAVHHFFDIDVSYSSSSNYGRHGWHSNYSYDADWSSFGFELGIQYYF